MGVGAVGPRPGNGGAWGSLEVLLLGQAGGGQEGSG